MQNTLLFTTALLAISSVGLAQSYTSSPKGYENVEGDSNASVGGYPNGRYMYFDGDVRGTAMTIKGLAYRHDNLIYNPTSQGQGRSWTNVTLDIADCDVAALSNTFTKNPTSTPTRVMSGAVTWPTQNGKPKYFPADFSLVFPFQGNWVYSGKADICADWVYTGGTLANNAAWGTSSWSYYYVDGVDPSSYSYVKSAELGNSGNNTGCNDRNLTNLYGAQLNTDLYFYSRSYSNGNYAGNLVYHLSGNYFGPNALVISALSVKSQPAGWNFPGVYCNKAYIDPNFILTLVYTSANSSGTISQISFGGTYGIKAPPGVAGIELVMQGIWKDTANFRPLLSSAAALTIPKEPAESAKFVLSNWNITAPTGSGPTTSNANPLLGYAR